MNITTTIRITEQDIADGVPYSAGCCPAAMAVKRALPDAKSVSVLSSSVGVVFPTDTWRRRIAMMPPRASKFVLDFDSDKPVEPLAFRLTFA